MRRHIEELLKLSHENGKEPGTFRIVRKDLEGRYYLVEVPGAQGPHALPTWNLDPDRPPYPAPTSRKTSSGALAPF